MRADAITRIAVLTIQTTYAMSRRTLSLLGAALLVAGCGADTPQTFSVALSSVESPAGPSSGEPYLSVVDGTVYMSWLEKSDGGHDLRFASFDGSGWTKASTVVSSDRFFVNWADFPSIRGGPDGTLWAHWLQRGDVGGYDYGVQIARSGDGGATWSEPFTLHDDDSSTEHGFVSAVTVDDAVGFFWLDGRKYADAADGTPASDEMTVRYRAVASDGTPGREMLVDGRTCDCCQTAAAVTSSGPIVAYRDRTEDEIRDIYVARMVDGEWLDGTAVHDDGWEIAGCPVNGPAIGASGDEVVVAWFTGANDTPHAKVAFSSDGGATFATPITVDDGNPAGRVDLFRADDGSAIVVWLERTGGQGAEVRLRRVTVEGHTSESVAVTGGSAERASGFPRLVELEHGSMMLAWTDISGEAPRVRVTRLQVEE
jgi:hypothetical protein